MEETKRFQLTIIVPAYNAERYLHKCLDSMAGRDERLEILVVDDGSTDRTGEIADKHAAQYPGQVRVIHKENGGHGSGINVGAAEARGRYFKVIDADDWIVTENLSAVLDRLEGSDAHLVMTGFCEVDCASGETIVHQSACGSLETILPASKLPEIYSEIHECFSFHGMMYQTEWYRTTGIKLSEHVYYEDQEYATLPVLLIRSFEVLPFLFYQYAVGNADQSVSYANQVKHMKDYETVLAHMVEFAREQRPLPEEIERYYLTKLSLTACSYLSVALVKMKNKKEGRRQAKNIYDWLLKNEPAVIERIRLKYACLRLYGMLGLSPGVYQWIAGKGRLQWLRSIWTH